ncbi:MAG: hypothetical protein QOF60_3307 [Actinomycetota bacterium]|jgi:hypothetical protein|nr:hypothetical protein [Actinomycetota bacterium]
MSTYVVRIWIPDRPGALGAVASRIGAVRGDLIGIDILERGAGLAIDELVVTLPDDSLVPLLVHEIGEVDGVAVEDLRPVAAGAIPDPRLAALETAAYLAEQTSPEDVLAALVVHAAADFEAMWAAVVEEDAGSIHAAVGEVPPAPWITAFVAGSRTTSDASGPDDIAWARLARSGLDVVLGRPGRPVRQRERQQLSALARIADLRWTELARGSALRLHPSAV